VGEDGAHTWIVVVVFVVRLFKVVIVLVVVIVLSRAVEPSKSACLRR
jgi:hypothetical protein